MASRRLNKPGAKARLARARASRSTAGPAETAANLTVLAPAPEIKAPSPATRKERGERPPLKYSAKLVTITCFCRRELTAGDGEFQCPCGRRWVAARPGRS